MTLGIRTAALADAAHIARLASQLGYEVETPVLADRLAGILARPDQALLVAEHHGAPVAWIHLVRWEFLDTEPFVVVAGLVVDRDHRRSGIGRTLMGRAEDWARLQKCDFVRLWSSASRVDAHRFYERLGYVNLKTQYAFAKAVDPSASERLQRFVPRARE